MKKVIQPLAWYLVLASILALASSFALNLVSGTVYAGGFAHDHQHGASAPVALPPEGEKWASDAPLREGMARIRQLIEQQAASSRARDLERALEAEVATLIEHCRLAPQADAALHQLLGELLSGAEALAAGADREQALVRMHGALQRYPQLFADPSWQAPTHSARH